MRQGSGLWLASALGPVIVFALLFNAPVSPAASTNDVFTNAADIISLPADRAVLQLKVFVTGIVTAADPALKGRFFIQDSTGGIFVDNDDGQRPEPGDVLEISGLTMSGAYAPVIIAPQKRKIGVAPLPAARLIPIERLMSGAEDSQRIETSGIVRAARVDGARLVVDLMSGGYRFRAYAPIPPGVHPQTLVAARVRVRGTAAEAHNRMLRQLISAEVYVPVLADFIVEKPESASPFDQSIVPLSSLAQYHRDNSFNDRVHVKGVVTLQRVGESLFLRDSTGGLQVQSREPVAFSPGDVIEAVGFPNFENYLPVLQDAVFRKTDDAPIAVAPKPASLEDVQSGLHHADYVSFKGRLVDRTVKHIRRQVAAPVSRTTLMLQSTNFIFTAEAEEPQDKAVLEGIPLGSTVEVSGICLTEIDSDGKMKSFRILIRSAEDVRILERPSWFTPRRLLIGLAILLTVLVLSGGWTVILSKKNSALNYLIREREKVRLELQRAHDMLEERVKERTAQLKFQITARKESELQFKAVLGERTRLAQELHDTLEQTLTGIALQLDTASKLFGRNSDDGIRHVKLARNLLGQSQVDVRRSVWDLRCRALEQFDLPGALLRSARQFTDGTGIEVAVETVGQPRPLPEVVEENLLRIGQEALTNVIKHSRAAAVKIELEFGVETVILQIVDDGHGFDPSKSVGAREGHFGVVGMSERAKRLGGRVVLNSAPDRGTTVRVEIPLGPTQEFKSLEPAEAEMQS